jgi:L-ascorbate metabolism protein UlaG (beta-lactamase superfamily)
MSSGSGSLKNYALRHLKWYGQSAFRIAADSGVSIAVDPFRIPASAGPVDMVLITHPHFDHYDRRAAAALKGSRGTVVVPEGIAERGLEGIRPGQTITIADLSVSAVPAYCVGKPFHAKSRGWVGYIIMIDGLTIYHAGDTDFIPEMKSLRPDIALLPVGGRFTMNVRGAAEAAEALQAGLVIPMHYGWLLGGNDAGAKFVEAAGQKAMVLSLSD